MECFNFITGQKKTNTSWHKHVMEEHVLSNQTGLLSGQNLSLHGQTNDLLTDKD